MNPIIRWAGSKRQLLPKLSVLVAESYTRYIEPFCGSACLFFTLEPKEAILGDLNLELTTTYRALKKDASLVIECIKRLPVGEKSYYQIRAINPNNLSDAEVAARFLYLNRYCFNGIYRTNRKGVFNVPYGPPRSGATFDYDRLLKSSRLLSRATIVNADFEDTIKQVKRNDFVYLDPPYATNARRIFAEYQANSFATSDLQRFNSSLRQIDSVGAKFVVSYADCPEARAVFRDWKLTRIMARRHIAGFSDKRRHAYEIIATNT